MGTLVTNYGIIVPCVFLAWITVQTVIGIRTAAKAQAIRRRLQW